MNFNFFSHYFSIYLGGKHNIIAAIKYTPSGVDSDVDKIWATKNAFWFVDVALWWMILWNLTGLFHTHMRRLCLCTDFSPYGAILFWYTIKLFYLRYYDPNRKFLSIKPMAFFASYLLFGHFMCFIQIPSKLATPFSFSVNEHFHFGVCSSWLMSL